MRSLSDEAIVRFWANVGMGNGRKAPPTGRPGPRGFWDYVDKSAGATACWPWTDLRRMRKGYGSFETNGTTIGAHRYAWELTNGPIPDGLWVLHRCDNPPCCNPSHLFLGTNSDNVADRKAKGRTKNGKRRKPYRRVLTSESVAEIRKLIADGASCTSIASKYDVSRNCIDSIKNGRTWNDRPEKPTVGTTNRMWKTGAIDARRTDFLRSSMTERLYDLIRDNPWCTISQLSEWVCAPHADLYTSLRQLRGMKSDCSAGRHPARVHTTGGRRWMRYAIVGVPLPNEDGDER